MPDYTWAPKAGRYRDPATGLFVPEARVRAGVDALADDAGRRMAALAARWRGGELATADWLQLHLAEVKRVQVAAALAAYGGRGEMTPARWGYVGQLIRQQYAYARQMATDVLEGRARMNGRLDARAAMYGQAGRVTYEAVRRREEAGRGMRYEQNHLHARESCAQCRAQSALGQVPVGTLVPIGGRTCRSMCRCTITFSYSTAREALSA